MPRLFVGEKNGTGLFDLIFAITILKIYYNHIEFHFNSSFETSLELLCIYNTSICKSWEIFSFDKQLS